MVEDRRRDGRPKEMTSEELRNKCLEYVSSRKYHVTVRTVANWLKSVRGTGCTDSARKLIHALGCRRVRVNLKPKLERKHILSRFLYCWERLEELRISRSMNVSVCDIQVFVDDNWFNQVTMGGYLWLPDSIGIEKAAEFWRHKSHIPKIMYFAAIAMTRL